MGEQLSSGALKATNIVKGDDDDDEAVCLQRGGTQEKTEGNREKKCEKRGNESFRGMHCLALKCIMVEFSRAPQLGRP